MLDNLKGTVKEVLVHRETCSVFITFADKKVVITPTDREKNIIVKETNQVVEEMIGHTINFATTKSVLLSRYHVFFYLASEDRDFIITFINQRHGKGFTGLEFDVEVVDLSDENALKDV